MWVLGHIFLMTLQITAMQGQVQEPSPSREGIGRYTADSRLTPKGDFFSSKLDKRAKVSTLLYSGSKDNFIQERGVTKFLKRNVKEEL